jgi:ribosomal protein S18 acetylase RimI-like enzyme
MYESCGDALMSLLMREYAGESDVPLIAELINAAPPTGRHLIDFPWRLSSSPATSMPDARLWLSDGRLVGFAAWQIWWAVLDFYIRPGPAEQEVEKALFDWAGRRFRELDQERGQPFPYWVEGREDDRERLAMLARRGYTLDTDYTYVMLSRSLTEPIPPADPPAGFTIRPLAGPGEAEAYAEVHRRAFGSTAMTAAWRTRTLSMPNYLPALDLVAVTPDGRFAGFCVGWLSPERRTAQIEPLGVDPEFQGQRLGRALLLEMLGRFRAHGAEYAQVETDSGRSTARRAYEAVGFKVMYRTIRKGQWFAPNDVSSLPPDASSSRQGLVDHG